MPGLQEFLDAYVRKGVLLGSVAVLARGDRLEVAVAGSAHADGSAPMRRDSIFRLASLTKAVTAAALLMLVDDGRVTLDQPVDGWLPELADRRVLRTPASPLDEVVAAVRPITVFDLLTSQAGLGWAADSELPFVRALFPIQRDGREPLSYPSADEWMAELGQLPLLGQPGEFWLYDTCSTVQGILVARVCGQSLPEFLAQRIFEPLGMDDSGFTVAQGKRDRFTSYYRNTPEGFELADGPDGQWAGEPPLPLGHGGLVGTADDVLKFHRMLLADGVGADGKRLLSTESVRLMHTDHTTPASRALAGFFLDGQGWGCGGSVDIAVRGPWNAPGRYGWVGGTGTSAYHVPATGAIDIVLTQVAVDSPVPAEWLEDFWRFAAQS
ncbi:serine hydrolase domain-containing protein [Nocardia huaxiensis]|uniref:serine hydrolase domain-containing protein n=1 Tax=Nocardia huaxiensis TaxID=2755382 RepID=UPI001E452338|nr:serine hydrolase domain-containing protein [Nocardia huaxiensis]UFS98699.1 beta-lactamase family protein [Nocardia huaxiensis]